MTNYKRIAGVLMAAALVFAPTACSSENDTGSAFLDMRDNFFNREVTRVPVGEQIVFTNEGISPHNAIATDGSWATSDVTATAAVEPGEKVTLIAEEPGVYEFFCSFHGTENGDGMAAVLVVGDIDYTPRPGAASLPVVDQPSGRTIEVPEDFDTIQQGVDATDPGDLVLVGPGIYREEVTITTPSITLRGRDRNRTIIDGEFERENGVQVFSDGVAVENMTARNNILNGFFWSGVKGYRAGYLTAINNADYGIYAFDSVDGAFRNSYASGSPDSGFYIGQCYPCNAVIDHVTAERNSLGYSGTNAGGDLYIINSTWIDNRAGIVPNTLDSELLAPQRETTIAGNLVLFNDNPEPVVKESTFAAYGNGIVIAGGSANRIQDNIIKGHANHGILITANLDEHLWFAQDNVVVDNQIRDSGRADIALSGPGSIGNCFQGNSYDTSAPPALQRVQTCDGIRLPLGFDMTTVALSLGYVAQAPDGSPSLEEVAAQPGPGRDFQNIPLGAENAPVVPAVDVFDNYDRTVEADSLAVPIVERGQGRRVTLAANVYIGPNVWSLLFGLYGYLLPFVLYAAWTSLAFWDLARREETDKRTKLVWIAVILLVPFLGAIAYHAFGHSSIPAWMRAAIVGGGIAAYLIILAIGAFVGGIV